MIAKRAGETKQVQIDLDSDLAVDDKIIGTPTVAEVQNADLTISSIEVESDVVLVDQMFTWPRPDTTLARRMSFLVAGGTAGQEYTLRATIITDSGQTLIRDIKLRVN